MCVQLQGGEHAQLEGAGLRLDARSLECVCALSLSPSLSLSLSLVSFGFAVRSATPTVCACGLYRALKM